MATVGDLKKYFEDYPDSTEIASNKPGYCLELGYDSKNNKFVISQIPIPSPTVH